MEKLYLVARIADTRGALRSRTIHSVGTVGQLVEVPAAPPHVAGLFALRSRVFTLIDPHVVIGLSPVSVAPGQRVIVVEVAEHGYALLADEIEDVCFIEAPETRIAGKLLPGWRPEERRVGKGGVSTCKFRWVPHHTKKNNK